MLEKMIKMDDEIYTNMTVFFMKILLRNTVLNDKRLQQMVLYEYHV